jgi:hypothetical protein
MAKDMLKDEWRIGLVMTFTTRNCIYYLKIHGGVGTNAVLGTYANRCCLGVLKVSK